MDKDWKEHDLFDPYNGLQVIAPIPRFGFHHSTWETQFPWPYNTHEQLKYKLQNSLNYYYIYIYIFCLSKILKVGLYQYQRLGHTTYFRPRCILILRESSCMGWMWCLVAIRFMYFRILVQRGKEGCYYQMWWLSQFSQLVDIVATYYIVTGSEQKPKTLMIPASKTKIITKTCLITLIILYI